MRNFKRIIGVVLVIALFVCSFASCEKKKENRTDPISDANKALAENTYFVQSSLKYTSDDADMLTAIGSFRTPTIQIRVDKDKFEGTLDITHGTAINYLTYTFVDGVLYTEWKENGKTVKNKQTIGAEDKATLKDNFGVGANVTSDDFNKVVTEDVDGKTVVKCSDIKDDALLALVNVLKDEFAAANMTVSVALKNATLNIEIVDGKYDTIDLVCEYYISTAIDSYSIGMTYSSKFNYGGNFEIVAPAFD